MPLQATISPMCGITGVFQQERVDPETVTRYCLSIRHRGPDDTGIFTEGGVGLGMTRLAIIDLEGGRQPMQSGDRKVTIVFNGEIYNFRELRAELEGCQQFHTHSDTEVILNGYLEWGEAVFQRLNGIFAIAIWDGRRDELLLARDPMGVKPLYYLKDGKRLVFSSEMKTFTECGIVNQLSHKALLEFLAAGYVFHPGTVLEGVRSLEPGHYLKFNGNGATEEQEFFGLRAIPQKMSEGEALELLRTKLEEAILRQTVSDVPIGLLLSSGLDSTYLLGVLRKHGLTQQLNTFTVVYDDERFSEGESVARLVREWGIKNETLRIDGQAVASSIDRIVHTLDNLETLPTASAMMAVSELAARHNKVVFSGIGGDELFFGYPTHRATALLEGHPHLVRAARPLLGLLSRLPASGGYLPIEEKAARFLEGSRFPPEMAHMLWRHVFTWEEMGRVLNRDWLPGLAEIMDPQTAYFKQARERGFGGMDVYGYVDLKTWLVDCCLAMWDKAGMSASVEIRVPFLDLEFVRAVMSVSMEIRGRRIGKKYLLRRLAGEVLPDYIIENRKRGFQVPIGKWLRGPLHDRFTELTDALPQEIFNQTEIRRLWELHRSGRQDTALKLWSLGMLSLWGQRHGIRW